MRSATLESSSSSLAGQSKGSSEVDCCGGERIWTLEGLEGVWGVGVSGLIGLWRE